MELMGSSDESPDSLNLWEDCSQECPKIIWSRDNKSNKITDNASILLFSASITSDEGQPCGTVIPVDLSA